MNVSQMKSLQRKHERKELVDIDFKVSMTPPKSISDQMFIYGVGRLVFFTLEISTSDRDNYSDIAIAMTKAGCKVYLYRLIENSKEKSATVESFDCTEGAFSEVLATIVQNCRPEDIEKYVRFNLENED